MRTYFAKENPVKHGKATHMQNDDNTILCLSCGEGAGTKSYFSSKDFVKLKGSGSEERIKQTATFFEKEIMKIANFLYI